MKLRSIRRIVSDSNHNMDTGAAFFKGAFFVTYRQGDAHVSPNGKILVLRSRDEGVSFEHVALLRGKTDTRDPHLYLAGPDRLHAVAFETIPVRISGTSWTEDGLHWSPFARYTGADGWWLWHPEYHNGRHYCAGYTWRPDDRRFWGAVAWFESDNGLDWRKTQVLREHADEPSETCLTFTKDDTALLLVRRGPEGKYKPLLMRSAPPYRKWDVQELDLPIAGMALWQVGDDVWFSGRWFMRPSVAQMGVFKMVGGKPELQLVLPAGPDFDFSYMGVARHPLNSYRYFLTYYSNHLAPDDPRVDQWSHPQIYLVDALFDAASIPAWQVSERVEMPAGGFDAIACPDPSASKLRWQTLKPGDPKGQDPGFVNAEKIVDHKPGVVYFVADVEVGPCDAGTLHLGYDGPVKVWVNGQQVFAGPGTNPAILDQTSIPVAFNHGTNRVAVALNTNGGKAYGIFGRYETRA